MRLALFLLALLFAASALAERQPYDRYRSIVDRQMFGPLPVGFDPTKLPSEVKRESAAAKKLSPEEEKLKSAVHFSVINVTPSGEIEVGFSDLSDPQTPMYYFLKVGETRDGWTVEKADADSATVTLSKDDIVLDLSLGNDSAKGDGAIAKKSAAAKPADSLRARRTRRQEREEAARKEEKAADERRRAEERAAQEDIQNQLGDMMTAIKSAKDSAVAAERRAKEAEQRAKEAEEKAKEAETKAAREKDGEAKESGDGENNDAS